MGHGNDITWPDHLKCQPPSGCVIVRDPEIIMCYSESSLKLASPFMPSPS